jgi:hypothetical protein
MDTVSRLFSNDHPLGRVLDRRHDKFDRLQRRVNSIQRNYLHALKELQHLEKTQPADLPDPAPFPSNQQPIPEIGFVPEAPETQAEPVGQALPPANSSCGAGSFEPPPGF